MAFFKSEARGRGGGRTSHMKGVGMLVGNLKKTDLGLAEALFDP